MITRRTFLLLALAVVFVTLSSCAGILSPKINSVARQEARIGLARGGEEILWQNSDLAMTYSFHEAGNNFILKGKLVFDGSVTNNFETIKHFKMQMSFLDSERRVLEHINITPFYSFMEQTPDSMAINVSHPKPAGSQAIAFSYFGVFKGYAEDIGGDEWIISYFPYN